MCYPALKFESFAEFSEGEHKFHAFNPQGEEEREAHWKSFESVRNGFYGSSANRIQRGLREQRDFILDNVRQSRRPEAVPNAVQAATGRMAPIYKEAVMAVAKQVIPTFADLTLDSFPKSARLPVEEKQDGDNDIWFDEAQRYVRNNTGTLITAPNETTKRFFMEAATAATRQGLEEGWGIPRIAEKIEEETGKAIGKRRSTVIARTEVIRASNYAATAAADATNLALNKEWIATMDDRVRDTHFDAHGQIVPQKERFTVGGYKARYPADPALPASESVQCRCTVAFLERRQ